MNNPLYLRILCDVHAGVCSYESGEWIYRPNDFDALYETLVIWVNEDDVLYFEMYNIPESDKFPNITGELHSTTQLKELLDRIN
jgi:hypothetical protein